MGRYLKQFSFEIAKWTFFAGVLFSIFLCARCHPATFQVSASDLPPLAAKAFRTEHCDQILKNQGYFLTCYSYRLKDPLAIYDQLSGPLVVKERRRVNDFHPDNHIPKVDRSYPSDYSHSGYDRGHSGANNASFDWAPGPQKATFVMSNMVPQRPLTNRRSYKRVENYGRALAVKHGMVNVLTINIFSAHPSTIGKDKVAIPIGFWKIYWWGKQEQCFYIPNDNKIYKLKEMQRNCADLPF